MTYKPLFENIIKNINYSYEIKFRENVIEQGQHERVF